MPRILLLPQTIIKSVATMYPSLMEISIWPRVSGDASMKICAIRKTPINIQRQNKRTIAYNDDHLSSICTAFMFNRLLEIINEVVQNAASSFK